MRSAREPTTTTAAADEDAALAPPAGRIGVAFTAATDSAGLAAGTTGAAAVVCASGGSVSRRLRLIRAARGRRERDERQPRCAYSFHWVLRASDGPALDGNRARPRRWRRTGAPDGAPVREVSRPTAAHTPLRAAPRRERTAPRRERASRARRDALEARIRRSETEPRTRIRARTRRRRSAGPTDQFAQLTINPFVRLNVLAVQ